MYMMNMGKRPVGECYITPPVNDECWLMGQFYAGESIKLIKFKKPMDTPTKNSIEQRLRDLEDHEKSIIAYTESMFERICDRLDMSYSSYNSYKTTAPRPSREIDTPYVICNTEPRIV